MQNCRSCAKMRKRSSSRIRNDVSQSRTPMKNSPVCEPLQFAKVRLSTTKKSQQRLDASTYRRTRWVFADFRITSKFSKRDCRREAAILLSWGAQAEKVNFQTQRPDAWCARDFRTAPAGTVTYLSRPAKDFSALEFCIKVSAELTTTETPSALYGGRSEVISRKRFSAPQQQRQSGASSTFGATPRSVSAADMTTDT